jgi:putative salt-induced outer membrane protein YdiY
VPFALALLVCLEPAHAEESTFVGARPEAEIKKLPEAHAAAEFGGILSFGNTESMALTGQGVGSYRWGQNAMGGTFGVNWGQSRIDTDGNGRLDAAEREADWVKTAERESATVRYDRFLGSVTSLYALTGAFTDSFAGYDYRVNAQVGASRSFVALPSATLKAELGVDVAQEDFVDGVDPNSQIVVSARLQVGARYAFNAHVAFEDTVEMYESLLDSEDVRLNNTASVTSALTGRLSLKLSHVLAFDNVPVEGYQPLDHSTLASVVLTFI